MSALRQRHARLLAALEPRPTSQALGATSVQRNGTRLERRAHVLRRQVGRDQAVPIHDHIDVLRIQECRQRTVSLRLEGRSMSFPSRFSTLLLKKPTTPL